MSGPRAVLVHSPEHVEIALEPAGLGRRGVAFLIDSALIGGGVALLARALALLPLGLGSAVTITLGLIVSWSYFPFFELLAGGRTPGKRALGLRVLDGRGLPLDLGQSLVRNAVRALDIAPLGGVGFFTALFDDRRRRLGDIVADTLVVEERRGGPLEFASAAGRRYNSLRTPRVRRLMAHRLGVEDREFLLALCVRASALTDEARHDLFEAAGTHYRELLEVDDDRLTGEAVVRGLVSVCYSREGE